MKCSNKGCGWFKDYDDGNYKSNCKMSGITQCDFKHVVSRRVEPVKELCIWDKADSDGDNMFGCGLSYLTPTNAVKRYKYCPYCGKPIKINKV